MLKKILKEKTFNKSLVDLRNIDNEYILNSSERKFENLFINEGYVVMDRDTLFSFIMNDEGAGTIVNKLLKKEDYVFYFKNSITELEIYFYDSYKDTVFKSVLDKEKDMLSEIIYINPKDKFKYNAIDDVWATIFINRCCAMLSAFNDIALATNEGIREVNYTINQNTGSKKANKAKKKSKINIIKKYTVTIKNFNPKKYTRHTLGWEVRGHWRTYKNGKKVWIEPSYRGDKNKIEHNTYVL